MDDFVTLATFSSHPEAHVARGALEEQGIEALLEGEGLVSIYGQALGGIRLRVRTTEVERASAVLGILRRPVAAQVPLRCPSCGSLRVGRDQPMRWLVFLSWFLVGLPLPFFRARWKCWNCDHRWKSRWDALPEVAPPESAPERPVLRLEPRVLHVAVPPWDGRSETMLAGFVLVVVLFLTAGNPDFRALFILAGFAAGLFALAAVLTRRTLRVVLRDTGLLLDGPDGDQEFPLQALDARQLEDGRLRIGLGGSLSLQGVDSGKRDAGTVRLAESDLTEMWVKIRELKGQDSRIWERGAERWCPACGLQFARGAEKCSQCGGPLEPVRRGDP